MVNALALPVMRCLVLAVGGLAEKCLSSRIWRIFCSIKGYCEKIFWLQHEIPEALPNVQLGVEVDESGDLWVQVIEESVEWSVFFAQEAEPCQACDPRPV